MAEQAKQRLHAIGKQLAPAVVEDETFEGVPPIKQVARPSNGPRAQEKVVIITGNIFLISSHIIHSYSVSFASSPFPFNPYNPEAPCLQTPNPQGANSPMGIGRATAHQFAQNGARAVYICDFDDKYLGYHERQIKSLYPGVDVHTRKFDAADEPAVKEVVEDALRRYGRLDVMFANAGIVGDPVLFSDTSKDDFMKVMRVNALG